MRQGENRPRNVSGLELLSKGYAPRPDVPIIMMTAMATQGKAAGAGEWRRGASDQAN
jgi:hypothetical protein